MLVVGICPRIQCRLHCYTSRWRQGFFTLCVSQSVADSLKGSYDTKTIKPIINEAFVASSGDIITDYNDSYGLTITMSAFVIGETTNTTLHSSKLAFESPVANSLNMKTYLQTVTQKHQTVLAKLQLPTDRLSTLTPVNKSSKNRKVLL